MKNEGGMDRKDEGGIDRKGERMMRGERRKEITKNGSPVHSQKVNFYIQKIKKMIKKRQNKIVLELIWTALDWNLIFLKTNYIVLKGPFTFWEFFG